MPSGKFANTIIIGVEVAEAIEDVALASSMSWVRHQSLLVDVPAPTVPDVAGRDAGGAVTNDDEFVTVDSERECPGELWVVGEEWVGVVAAVPVGPEIAVCAVVGLVQVDVLDVRGERHDQLHRCRHLPLGRGFQVQPAEFHA